jgi:C4-dicarboxylate transporter DctM subunit
MDDPLSIGLILLGIMAVMLLAGFWLAMGLMSVGIIGGWLFTDLPMGDVLTRLQFGQSASFVLLAIPMFVLMGQLLYVSGIVDTLYEGLSPFVARLPGKLLQTNIVAAGMMSAITGSSVATCATIASIAVPSLKKKGYDPGPVVGTIGGASLGLLIPPSIFFIVYGMLTEQSVRDLYLAGILPGVMIEVMFMVAIGALALARPGLTPSREVFTKRDYLMALPNILPVLLLMLVVLGVMYLGITTVTEAAAVGVLGSLVVAAVKRRLTWKILRESMLSTVRTTGMLVFIMVAALSVSNVIGYLNIPTALANAMVDAAMPKLLVFILIVIMYLFLGTFLDGMSMILLTLPVIYPVITLYGYDPIWFAVFLCIMIEIGQMTPPLGFDLYVLQDATKLPLSYIFRWQIPFIAIMLLGAVLLYVFPQIALVLVR